MPFKNFKMDNVKIIAVDTGKEITLSEIAEFETASPSELEKYNFPIPLDNYGKYEATITGTIFYRLPLKYRIFFKLKNIVHKVKEIYGKYCGVKMPSKALSREMGKRWYK